MLLKCGYDVITATNGKEGIDLYKERKDDIKAVILDMAMPIMSGKDAFIEMKKINNEVKVVLSSGFKQDERIQEVIDLGIKTFLQKPFTLAKLADALNKVINS